MNTTHRCHVSSAIVGSNRVYVQRFSDPVHRLVDCECVVLVDGASRCLPAEMSEAPVDAEVAIIKRASDITTPAEWIVFFEWCTFARLFKVTVLLVFGAAVFNVNAMFGVGFESYVSTATY